MSDFPALTIQSGIQRQIQDANFLQVGAGIKPRGASTNLELFANTGAIILSDNTTVLANKNITAQAGTSALDFSLGTGIFSTSTGAVTINGATSFAANKGITVAAGTSAFDFSGGTGIFKTSTGTNTVSGAQVFAANVGLTVTAGTSAFDFSGGTGIFKTSTGAVTIGNGVTTMSGVTTFTAAGTALTVNNNAAITGNLTVGGNLTVSGTTFTTHSESVNIDDNHLLLNNAYTTAVAQTGGLVINYLPTATATTVAAGGFATTSTIATTGAATFAAGDIILVSGATDPANDGIYEVLTHAANVLTIDTTPLSDFVQNVLVVSVGAVGAITKVNVSVLRAGTDGIWETGIGATAPLTFTDLATGGTVSLQTAYVTGNTITTSAGEGAVTIDGDQDFILGGTVDAAWTTTGGFTATALTGAVNLTTTAAMTMRGGTGATFGDDTGIIFFNGSGAVSTTGITTFNLAPSAAITLTAGAASTWSTSAGALTITSAAAATWSTAAGALTITSAAAATWSTAAGALSIDAAAALNLGVTNATSIAIGHSGITTTVTGGLTQLTGAVSLAGNGASSFTTSAGALTLTGAAASTWSTTAGALTINGTGGINLQGGATTALAINSAGTTLIVQGGATLSTTGTGNIDLPNNASARFKIETTAVSANVTAANLGTLTAGAASNADALHTHTAVTSALVGTTGTSGEALAVGAPVLFDDAAGTAKVFRADANGAGELPNVIGLNQSAVGAVDLAVTVIVFGRLSVPDAAFTGGVPAVGDVGKYVFLSETVGLLTLTAPTTSGSTILIVGTVSTGGTGAVQINVNVRTPTIA